MLYFLQDLDGGPIKIGHSGNVHQRLRQLETCYGRPLALLATMEGGACEERAVHRRFAHLRYGRTEQFMPAADLMAFIGRPLLVGPNPDAVEVMPPVVDDAAGRIPARQFRLDDETLALLDWIADYYGISRTDAIRLSARETARARGAPAELFGPVA